MLDGGRIEESTGSLSTENSPLFKWIGFRLPTRAGPSHGSDPFTLQQKKNHLELDHGALHGLDVEEHADEVLDGRRQFRFGRGARHDRRRCRITLSWTK